MVVGIYTGLFSQALKKMAGIKIIIIVLILFSFIPLVSAPIWYGSGDDSGLVLRMSCEGNFLDGSGQGNDGTQSGGVTITSGVKGRACGFDGVNDWISLGSASSLDNLDNITISFWFKTKGSSTVQEFIDKNGVTTNRFFLANNRLTFVRGYSTANSAAYSSSSIVSPNTWYHVVGVRESKITRLYVNGTILPVSVDDVNGTGTLNDDSGATAIIGQVNAGYWLNGTIDEVRIYNRSLSTTEISSLYDTGKTYHLNVKTTPTLGIIDETPAPTLTDESGLVGWWKMDGDATDSSGQGNDGTVSGATITTDGRWNGAYEFTNDNILVSPSANINFTNNIYSISAWQKMPIDYDTYNSIFVKATGNLEAAPVCKGTTLFFRSMATGYRFETRNSTAASPIMSISPTGVINGGWNHLVGVVNGTHQFLYINGVLRDSDAIQGGDIMADTSNLIFGRGPSPTTGNTVDSTIDEIRIYNRSLSADEVKELYLSKGLVGHWKMDADQRNATSTFDSSGYNNHGLISGAILTNEGRFKEGMKFDGVNNNISITHSQSVNLSGNLTISTWINPSQTTVLKDVLRKYDPTGIKLNYWILIDATGQVQFYIGGASTANAARSVTLLSPNNWYHITGVYNGTTNIYINGIYEAIAVTSLAPIVNTQNVHIGGGYTDTRFFNGSIDEVRIYNRALSASEVAGLYNGTKSNKIALFTTPTLGLLNDTPAPEITDNTGLVGLWNLNGNALDTSGQGNDGTVTGATSTSAGRWSGAYSFDGNDKITTATYNLSHTANWTISAWFKNICNGNQFIYGHSSYDSYVANDCTVYSLYWNGSNNIWSTNRNAVNNSWNNIITVSNGTHFISYMGGTNIGTSKSYPAQIETATFYMGSNKAGTASFNGTIDEVRIYNRSLSAEEVKELYLSKGLVGHWKMDADQKNSTSTFDSSGYYNHGLITGAVQTNEGRFKEGMKFDGLNDKITSSPILTNITNFTVSAWIYPMETGKDVDGMAIMAKSASGFNRAFWFNYAHAGDAIALYMSNSTTANICVVSSGANTAPARKWSMATATFNSSGCYIYVNGEYKNSDNTISGLIENPSGWSNNLVIGWETGNRYFNGTIDEVRIYNRALSASEVEGLYNGTKSNRIQLWSVIG